MRFWNAVALAIVAAIAMPSADADAKAKARSKVSKTVSKAAAAERFRKALDRLDPQTRLEQICDLEAVNRIKQDKQYSPDRAQGAASAEPKTEGHKLISKGGAFRSKGDWYELTFVCEASPDHMKVLSFEYQTGKPIPKAKWEEYGLWQ